MEHLFYEKLPEGIKTIFYQGKRFSIEEFNKLKDNSRLKSSLKKKI
jgi:hypothetical protein